MTVEASPPRTTGRTLAPDLARGLMLMLIAMANIPWYLWGSEREFSLSHPTEGSSLDRAAQFVTMLAVDQRVYPMFAFLFGYGMVQFAASRSARGVPERTVRRMLRRRHWAMIGFGLVHAALLFEGDILGIYGGVGLVTVWLFFTRRDRTVVIWLSLIGALLLGYLVLSVLGGIAVTMAPDPAAAAGSFEMSSAAGTASYPASVVERLVGWLTVAVIQLVSPVIPACVLLGWLAARHRVLEEPARHLRLLRWTAAIGLTVGLAGGLVNALNHLGVFGTPPEIWWSYYTLASITGLVGGLGYVAVFGLLAHRLRRPDSTVVQLITAVGKRSLSCYLAQSIVFAPVLAAWGLGVGGWLGSAGALLMACVTWFVIALGALVLERTGRRGPAEVLLRRLTAVTP